MVPLRIYMRNVILLDKLLLDVSWGNEYISEEEL